MVVGRKWHALLVERCWIVRLEKRSVQLGLFCWNATVLCSVDYVSMCLEIMSVYIALVTEPA